MQVTITIPTPVSILRQWRWTLLAALVLAFGLVGGDGTALAAGNATFGDGSDGPMTFSSNTTLNPPADAAVNSASSGASSFVVSSISGSFSSGQKILIHQTRGSGAGTWEVNEVSSYAASTIFTAVPLTNSYSTAGAQAAQVLVVPEFTNMNVNAGVTVSAKPWGGATGGIVAAFVSGVASLDGSISAIGAGYSGGAGAVSTSAFQGEGHPGFGVQSGTANGNGGGGGSPPNSGGGGGLGTAGSPSADGADGGLTAGTSDLTSAIFGGGGGGSKSTCGGLTGGRGGGIIFLFARDIVMTSGATIAADGSNGGNGEHGSGGGAGGSILIRAKTAALDGSIIRALGGAGGSGIVVGGCGGVLNGGGGGEGRIRLEYCSTISGGTVNPFASIQQIGCKASSIVISNVGQYALPKSCFQVRDASQTPMFVVCDNDFAGAPASNATCQPDGVCEDEDTALGFVKVSVDPSVYHVVINSVASNHAADASNFACNSGPTCALTFTNTPKTRPWHPWDLTGTGAMPDGKVRIDDILAVIQHYFQDKALP